MRRSVSAAAALALSLGVLTACGDEEKKPAASDQDPEVIEVTFEGDTVDPSGDVVKVAVDQPVQLVVTADTGGEIHVHTKPDDQELEYGEGTTTLEFTVDKPGLVDIESHDLEQLIVKLEVE
jgi:hypothetical protein